MRFQRLHHQSRIGFVKRYLIQLVRVFSHFRVAEQTRNGVNYNRVPCRYADASRMASMIMRNNSENMLNNAPMITLAIQSIQPARDRSQDPFLVDTQQVAERKWDEQNGVYTSEQGNLYTTKRYMPVPYNLTLQVDVYTTNTDSKLQILEQLFVIFNPSIQLQSNENPLDWSNVFEVELTDIIFSSRSIPAGTDDVLDVATLTFSVPIWISPPAKVQRQKIIQQFVNDIHNTESVVDMGFDDSFYDFFSVLDEDSKLVVSPGDYRVKIEQGTATLVNLLGQPQEWAPLIEMIGEIRAVSRLELNISSDSDNHDNLVIGSIVANPINPSQLIFNLDSETLPSNTLTPVNKIINPHATRPGVGLPQPEVGIRYLLTEDISEFFNEWGNITANANDIVQWNGTEWTVAFDSLNTDNEQWVLNDYTNVQYRWTGEDWISSWQGTYNPGYWRLIL